MQKYKGLSEITMNNYMAIKWVIWKKSTDWQKKFNLPRLNQEEIDIMNNPITSTKTESVIKNRPKNKTPRPNSFTGEFYETCKEVILSILLKLFQRIEEDETLPNSSYKVTYYPDIKTRQTQQKREKTAKIFNKYRCKDS